MNNKDNAQQKYMDERLYVDRFWIRVRNVRNEWSHLNDNISLNTKEFITYVKDEYGIELTLNFQGYIQPTYTIVDEQKHLLFLLKHE